MQPQWHDYHHRLVPVDPLPILQLSSYDSQGDSQTDKLSPHCFQVVYLADNKRLQKAVASKEQKERPIIAVEVMDHHGQGTMQLSFWWNLGKSLSANALLFPD
jgi:hypothetical protein